MLIPYFPIWSNSLMIFPLAKCPACFHLYMGDVSLHFHTIYHSL
jgi:hypothetical protein